MYLLYFANVLLMLDYGGGPTCPKALHPNVMASIVMGFPLFSLLIYGLDVERKMWLWNFPKSSPT